jgi:HCO3- transporter family
LPQTRRLSSSTMPTATCAFLPSTPVVRPFLQKHALSSRTPLTPLSPPAPVVSVPRRRRAVLLASASPAQPGPDPAAASASAAPGAPARPGSDLPLGPETGGRWGVARWGEGIRGDVARRLPVYLSDWTDGVRFKSVPAVAFLYFAVLAPVVAFGGMTAALTGGSLGVVECLLACGGSGMVYAAFSGQPLTFLAPTGLTLAFTSALYTFCIAGGVPFLPTYAWVGVWTSAILFMCAIVNASDLIKHCTRFTDDVFNSLIATNFLYEATRNLAAGFMLAGADKTRPFMTLALALSTWLVGRGLSSLRSSRFLFRRARNVLSDFGPCIAIASMSALAALPAFAKVGLTKLAIPNTFALAGNRSWLVPMALTPINIRFLCIIPALFLTCLFFLDQNISVRVVNSPAHHLKKSPAYHLDMLLLSVSVFICSILGLPLMCAGTIQSLNHVKALATYEPVLDPATGSLTGAERIVSVQENRLTGFAIHTLILASLFLLPVLSRIPMAVITGLFLFLGTNLINGNDFLARIPVLFMDPSRYPASVPTSFPARITNSFTLLQLSCLGMLWALKLHPRYSIAFPMIIGLLMFIRSFMAPRFFAPEVLAVLDGDVVDDEQSPKLVTE